MSDQLEHPDAAARPSRAAPLIRTVGLDGLLVSFAERLSEPANRAALEKYCDKPAKKGLLVLDVKSMPKKSNALGFPARDLVLVFLFASDLSKLYC